MIAEGSGAATKYFIQKGADTASKKLLGRPEKYYVTGYYNSTLSFSFNISAVYSNYKAKQIDDILVQMDSVCNNNNQQSWGNVYDWRYTYNQDTGIVTISALGGNGQYGGGWRGDPPKANIYIF